MAKKSFYKITSRPNRSRGIFHKIFRNKHKRQLVISISAVYVMLATVIGVGLFNSPQEPAQANQPAFIASVIDLDEDQKLQSGDLVELSLTLQNTSQDESINDITVSLLSTENVITWDQVSSKTKLSSGQTYQVNSDNQAIIPFLGAGEKADYKVTGSVQNHNFNSVSILAKLGYSNQRGRETSESNRLFVSNGVTSKNSNNLYSLNNSQSTYGTGQEIVFELTNPNNSAIDGEFTAGKIYITNQDTQNVVDSINCTFDENAKCQAIATDLESGSYSAIFLDENQNPSSITQFQVVGNNESTFTPSAESNLSLPFSNVSINGIVPIYASNLIGLNSTPRVGDFCEFKITRDGAEVTRIEAEVQSDRTCQVNLSSSQLPGEGVYNIALNGTNLNQDVSILNKPVSLLPISNKTLVLSQSNPVELEISKIANNGTKATIGILHTNSGEYIEVTNNGADDYISDNSIINTTIAGEYFEKGGLYQVFAKLDDGTQTDFINLNFNDNKVGLAGSGVIVDSLDNLQVDQDITFTVQNISDRNGNIIELGDCQAEIYTTNPLSSPILLNGQINNGNCNVEAAAGTITKAGPITVTFQGLTISNDINQSRQFVIKPGAATTLGDINFEYLPARINYANKLIVGPVTDGYGNLTDSLNNQVIIETEEGVQYSKNIDILEGFAQITIPSSIITEEELVLRILDADGNEELAKTITAYDSISPLNLPNLPTTLSSDENITGEFVTEADPEANECTLTYQRSKNEFIDNVVSVDSNYTCQFDFEQNVYRDNQQALLTLQAGQKSFAQVVTNIASEASNSFTLNPEIRVNDQDELVIKLLSSPIVDSQGQVINEGDLRVEYNGKVEEVTINNSHASIELPASKLDSQDIRKNLDKSFLELNLNAKAGVTSINSNNSLSIFIDNHSIANQSGQVQVLNATSLVSSNTTNIFSFATDNCNVIRQSNLQGSVLANSHYQAGICYVEVSGQSDNYSLKFEKDGFVTGDYAISITDYEVPTIQWCDTYPCNINILGAVKESSATLYDEDNQYKFDSNELGNVITIEQNGLNPLKEYPVELTYTLNNGTEVTSQNRISGELLQTK